MSVRRVALGSLLSAGALLVAAACGSSTTTARTPSTVAQVPPAVPRSTVAVTQPTATSSTIARPKATSTTTTVPPHPPTGQFTVQLELESFQRVPGGGQAVRPLPTRVYMPVPAGHAQPDAVGFPLLVWAHGFNATAAYFDALLRDWAAQGYVVAAPTFPETSQGGTGGPTARRFDDYGNQPADVSSVIDQLLALDGPRGREHPGLIDERLIAVGGHSLGAITARGMVASSAGLDHRIKAAIEVDGGALALPGTPRPDAVPTLLIHGDRDTTFPVSDSEKAYVAAVGPKWLVVLHGAPHTPFRVSWANALVEQTVADFLDAVLRADPAGTVRFAATVNASGRATLLYAP